MHTEDAPSLADFDYFVGVCSFFFYLKMIQSSQVARDVLWPKLIFSHSVLLQENVYVKSISVADTEPRIIWQKPPANSLLLQQGKNR